MKTEFNKDMNTTNNYRIIGNIWLADYWYNKQRKTMDILLRTENSMGVKLSLEHDSEITITKVALKECAANNLIEDSFKMSYLNEYLEVFNMIGEFMYVNKDH